MTRRRTNPRQCRRMDGKPKARYETKTEARRHANYLALENAYLCEVCLGWHVGHEPGTTMRKLLNLRLHREARAAKAAKRKAEQ